MYACVCNLQEPSFPIFERDDEELRGRRMALSGAERLNLRSLKRHDASVTSILDSTSYVVLYRHEGEEWTKDGIEGTLFLLQRESVANAFGIFILNRNGTDNFADDLDDEEDIELTQDFIIFRSPKTDIAYGIWVFETEHRARIGHRMQELAKQARSVREQAEVQRKAQAAPPAPIASTSALPAGQGLLDALFGAPAASSMSNGTVKAPEKKPDPGLALLDSIFGTPATATSRTVSMPAQDGFSAARESAKPSAILPTLPGARPLSSQQKLPASYLQEKPQAPSPSNLPEPSSSTAQQILPKPGKARPARVQGPLVPRMISTSKSKAASPRKETPPPLPVERPLEAEPLTGMSVLNEVLSTLASPTLAKANGIHPSQPSAPPVLRSGLSRNDFVREILTLLHTDSAFVDALYATYQSRS